MRRVRIVIFSILPFFLILAFLLIPKGQKEPPANRAPDLIKWEDQLYACWGEKAGAEAEGRIVDGYVSLTCPYNRVPEQNGEANFAGVGAPVIHLDNKLAVGWNDEWFLCVSYRDPRQ